MHTPEGVVQVGNIMHRRKHTSELKTGPQTRRGRYIASRGRCVQCYADAPTTLTPDTGCKRAMTSGVSIPQVCYACDVCRVLLCRNCFQHRYDHRSRGMSVEYVTLT